MSTTGFSAGIGPIRYFDCVVDGYLEGPYLGSPYLGSNIGYLSTQYLSGQYINYSVICAKLGFESKIIIDAYKPTGFEAGFSIDALKATGFEAMASIDSSSALGFEGLLSIDAVNAVGFEALIAIDALKATGFEALLEIDAQTPQGFEALVLFTKPTGMSAFIKLYNIDKLRVLASFDSRGVTNGNWTVQQGGTAPGDYSIDNINNDVWEHVYRSQDITITIDCDTGPNSDSRPDTFWFGNHNFTSGALITVLGSLEPNFVSPRWSFQFQSVPKEQAYYLVPVDDFPLDNVRYVRFIIDDQGNADGYLQFAHLIFGASEVLVGDCITENISKKYTDYKDALETEGFTSQMNHRALRKRVGFSLQKLDYNKGNYQKLVDNVFLEARTDLKCLWIPYPRYPTRFGVFAKMVEIPEESHELRGAADEDLDFVSFDITLDESL